jgi:hypothetical protein
VRWRKKDETVILRVPAGSPGWIFSATDRLAAIGDLKTLLSGGIPGAQRIARHLWRTCVGLFIAAGSFLLGQERLMPVLLRGSPLQFIPTFAPLVPMIFLLVRLRLTNMFRAFGNRSIGIEKHLEAA